MLGQPVSMLIPEVVGVRLTGRLREGVTATDLVLTVTQMLRKHGVVGKFVEFYGPGLDALPLADRATISNMAPEYGATCGFFPVDRITLDYLRLTGRDASRIALVEAYCRAQGLWRDSASPEPSSAKPCTSIWTACSPRWPARNGRRIASTFRTCAPASICCWKPAAGARRCRANFRCRESLSACVTGRWSLPPSRLAPTPPIPAC